MDKEVAAKVMKALLEAGSILAVTIDDVRGAAAEEEFKEYTRVVGELLGSIQLDLMAPIIRQYPDLDPDR
jgi:hypothetical protein